MSGRDASTLDRARSAIERARASLFGTALFADVLEAASPRSGAELTAVACDPRRTRGRDSLACFDALRAVGDRGGALSELTRVRTLLGGPALFLSLELRERLLAHDQVSARRVFGTMLPAERTLAGLAELSLGDRSPGRRAELLLLASTARDAPVAIAPLLRAAGDDPTREFDGIAEKLAARRSREPHPAQRGDGHLGARRAVRGVAGRPIAVAFVRRAPRERDDRRRRERPSGAPGRLGPGNDARPPQADFQGRRARPRARNHPAGVAGPCGPFAAGAGRRRRGPLRGVVASRRRRGRRRHRHSRPPAGPHRRARRDNRAALSERPARSALEPSSPRKARRARPKAMRESSPGM